MNVQLLSTTHLLQRYHIWKASIFLLQVTQSCSHNATRTFALHDDPSSYRLWQLNCFSPPIVQHITAASILQHSTKNLHPQIASKGLLQVQKLRCRTGICAQQARLLTRSIRFRSLVSYWLLTPPKENSTTCYISFNPCEMRNNIRGRDQHNLEGNRRKSGSFAT